MANYRDGGGLFNKKILLLWLIKQLFEGAPKAVFVLRDNLSIHRRRYVVKVNILKLLTIYDIFQPFKARVYIIKRMNKFCIGIKSSTRQKAM